MLYVVGRALKRSGCNTGNLVMGIAKGQGTKLDFKKFLRDFFSQEKSGRFVKKVRAISENWLLTQICMSSLENTSLQKRLKSHKGRFRAGTSAVQS